VKFDSVNLLKTTLSTQYLSRSRRIGYRRRKVVGMREADLSETALGQLSIADAAAIKSVAMVMLPTLKLNLVVILNTTP
jgi:hypothetical protein